MKTIALVAVILTAVLQSPVRTPAQTCPNCASMLMANYPKSPAIEMDIDSSFVVRCDPSGDVHPYVHVPPGGFIAWKLAPNATASSVVVEFGTTSPFDGQAHTFLVYKGQWTWARIRPNLQVDKDARCDGSNTKIYTYTISGLKAMDGGGVIVCPPDRPSCN